MQVPPQRRRDDVNAKHARPPDARVATAPADRLLLLQRHAGNRAVSDLLDAGRAPGGVVARQGQSTDAPPGAADATPIGPPILSDSQAQFLLDLDIDPASLPTAMQVRLGRALERTRRAHDALRGNVSADMGGSDVNASSTVSETGASLSVTVTDDEASITIRRYFDYASGRLVQSFSYEDVDANVLHATKESEGPNLLLARMPIDLSEGGSEGGGGGPASPPPPPLGDGEIDTFEDAVATEPEGSEEGVGSFVMGAVGGDFAENDSFSAIAGQTVVGFIPIVGQVADVRDMAAAIRGVAQGRDGAYLNVGIAAIGFIPGLDFLKGGSRVGRRVLRTAAEEAVEGVARGGLKRARRLMTREVAQQAARRLRQLEVGRTELIERLRRLTLDQSRHPELRGVANDAMNALRDHFKPSDLSGALRDELGIPVRMSGSGASFDHRGEVAATLNSLRRVREQLLREMRRAEPGAATSRELSHLSDALGELMRKTDEFLGLR